MPKLTPKEIQRELDQGKVWPVYWIYGSETMKSRELIKRVRKCFLGYTEYDQNSLSEEHLIGSEVSPQDILTSSQSLMLGTQKKLILIQEAQSLLSEESLESLISEQRSKDDLLSSCIFISREFDGRKKLSKILTKKTAVVECEEIPEQDREAWIEYLSKRRAISLPPEMFHQLRSIEPWSLDIIDQELEKYSLFSEKSTSISSTERPSDSNQFIDAFFRRDYKKSIMMTKSFANEPAQSLPLLGLLAWNVRQLLIFVKNPRAAKLNPYLRDKFSRWSNHWKLEELIELQENLCSLDFDLKQNPKYPLGIWSEITQQHCHH